MGVLIALCATGALVGGVVVWLALAFCRAAGEADEALGYKDNPEVKR